MESKITQKLAAILVADVAGYTRLMRDDERATVATLDDYRLVFREHIEDNQGRVVDMAGDSVLAVFEAAIGAAKAATAILSAIGERNEFLPDHRKMEFRIGVHLGDVIEKPDGTVYGDGVNIAARLEGLADPGTVAVSDTVRQTIEGKLGISLSDLGEHDVKNVAKPVRAYRILVEGEIPPAARRQVKSRAGLGLMATAAVAVALAIAGVAFWQLSLTTTTGPSETTDARAPQSTETEDLIPALPSGPSIAVLPFENLSGDPEQEYFSDGIAADIITDLSKISGLFVISRYSAFAIKNKIMGGGGGLKELVNATVIADELGVRYLLEGSVRKAGGQVRINVQLFDANTGVNLWAERYDRPLTDIFAMQDEITGEVVAALEVKLTEHETARVATRYTDNLEAYDYYLRGRSFQDATTRESNDRARAFLEKAVELDPDFAAAYAQLSLVHLQDYYWQWTNEPDRSKQLGLDTAQKAASLDGDLAEARTRLSWAYVWMGEFEKAVAEGRRAIELDPNYADAYLYLSHVLIYAGRPQEGIRVAEKGIRLDPRSLYHYLFHIADGHWMMGDHETAIEFLERSIEHNSNAIGSYIWLAALNGELGRLEDARKAADEVRRLSPQFSLEAHKRTLGYKDSSVINRMIDGLRKAGFGATDEATAAK